MLSYRLSEIVKLCKNHTRIADVGCDHGKVLGELAKNGANFLVASDISEPSVKKAEQLLTKLNFKNFDVRVGNGFETLSDSDNLDLIIVAGMGGLEIIQILKNSKIKLTNLILQPQNNVVKLREYLCNNNFYVQLDYVICDKDKFYNIIKVKKDNKFHKLTKREITFGKTNLKTFNPEFISMLESLNFKLANRVQGIKDESLKNEIVEIIKENNVEIERAKNRR